MNNFIEFIQNNISSFDLIFFLVVIYSMGQCAAKGFMRSLLSFSKWLLALIITIIAVPKLNPWVQDVIESKFIADIGLGIFIYIISLFIIINIGKAISRAVTWSGLGSVDKTFGLIFGIFRGYVICVCIFSLLNWFYPHEKWPIKTEDAYSFQIIYKGSNFLVEEFPNSKDYYEETGDKIENI
ncbi:CvpA family protein [Pelagibacteraceae bacterium]|jgi:membrane protein required for colicin V production|nr:CvpA family protein [Pelagibacteraceae bacterium]